MTRVFVITDHLGNPVFATQVKKDADDLAVSMYGESEAGKHVFKVVFG